MTKTFRTFDIVLKTKLGLYNKYQIILVTLKGEAQQELRAAHSILVHILRQNILNKNCTCKQNYHHIEFHRIITDIAKFISHST